MNYSVFNIMLNKPIYYVQNHQISQCFLQQQEMIFQIDPQNKHKIPSILILFNVQVIELSIVNKFNEDDHVLIETKGSLQANNRVFTVIKKKAKLMSFFELLQQLISIYKQVNFQLISYSPKPFSLIHQKLSSLTHLSQSFIYFNILPKFFSHIKANRAFLSYNDKPNIRLINYGQGFSQIKIKEELRLAVQVVFGQREIIWVLGETDEKEIAGLKKQGYGNVMGIQDFILNKQLIHCKISQIIKQYTKDLSASTSFSYIQTLKKSLPQKQFNQMSSIILATCPIPISPLSMFLVSPLKSLTITPKSTVRCPNSHQISAFIFKNLNDNRLYVGKSGTTKEAGGVRYDQHLEERCFFSVLTGVLQLKCNQFYSLKHDRSTTNMKHPLIKGYTSKCYFIAKPYLENLSSLAQYAKQFKAIITSDDAFQPKIQGLSSLLFWSIVSNQSLLIKPLLQQISLIKESASKNDATSKSDSLQYLKTNASLSQFLYSNKQSTFRILRFQYYQPFELSDYNVVGKQDDYQIILARNCRVMLTQINLQSLKQLYIITEVFLGYEYNHNYNSNIKDHKDNQPQSFVIKIIKGLIANHKWQYDKSLVYDILIARCYKLRKLMTNILSKKDVGLKQLNKRIEQQRKNHFIEIQQNNPILLTLLTALDHMQFTQPLSYYSFQSKCLDSQNNGNPYLQNMISKSHNFLLHGQHPPIFHLLNFIQSLNNMLNRTRDQFLLMGKKLKIMENNQKCRTIMVVDHGEVCEQIFEQQKNVRTIFVNRLKKGQHQIDTIYHPDTTPTTLYLNQANDQLLQTLFQCYQLKQSLQQSAKSKYLYTKYKWIIIQYIKIKCLLFKMDYEQVLACMFRLHNDIQKSCNRYKELQDKYKHQFLTIYCLPIVKRNQKIYFVADLQYFISIWKFQSLIINPNIHHIDIQVKDVLRIWHTYIDTQVVFKICQKLIQKLNKIKYDCSIQSKQQKKTLIQILQIMTSDYKHLTKKTCLIPKQLQLSVLHKSLFPQHQITYQYDTTNKINSIYQLQKQTGQISNYYLVHLEQSILVYSIILAEKLLQIQGKYSDNSILGWIGQQQSNGQIKQLLNLVLYKKQKPNQPLVNRYYLQNHNFILKSTNQFNITQQKPTNLYTLRAQIKKTKDFIHIQLRLSQLCSQDTIQKLSQLTIIQSTLQLDCKTFEKALINQQESSIIIRFIKFQQELRHYIVSSLLVLTTQDLFIIDVQVEFKQSKPLKFTLSKPYKILSLSQVPKTIEQYQIYISNNQYEGIHKNSITDQIIIALTRPTNQINSNQPQFKVISKRLKQNDPLRSIKMKNQNHYLIFIYLNQFHQTNLNFKSKLIILQIQKSQYVIEANILQTLDLFKKQQKVTQQQEITKQQIDNNINNLIVQSFRLNILQQNDNNLTINVFYFIKAQQTLKVQQTLHSLTIKLNLSHPQNYKFINNFSKYNLFQNQLQDSTKIKSIFIQNNTCQQGPNDLLIFVQDNKKNMLQDLLSTLVSNHQEISPKKKYAHVVVKRFKFYK